MKKLCSRALRALPAAAALATLAASPLAHATEVAPYFETWAYDGGYTLQFSLMQAKSSGGVLGRDGWRSASPAAAARWAAGSRPT